MQVYAVDSHGESFFTNVQKRGKKLYLYGIFFNLDIKALLAAAIYSFSHVFKDYKILSFVLLILPEVSRALWEMNYSKGCSLCKDME